MDLMDDAVKVLSVKGLHFFAFVGRDDFRKPIGRDKLNLAFDILETAHEAILVSAFFLQQKVQPLWQTM